MMPNRTYYKNQNRNKENQAKTLRQRERFDERPSL